jgi:predicted lipid-binding transport protein (Tim44 family)
MMKMQSRRSRALMVLAAVLALGIGSADAKMSGGKSFGSRGGRTYESVPSTTTAPRGAAPIERSMTQPGVQAPSPGIQRPAQPASGGLFGGRFGSFGAGLMGGLLGAGLLGMLFGGGLFGGLSGIGSLFGLLMQLALVGGLVWLALRFFRRRQEMPARMTPAMAGTGAGYARSGLGGLGGSASPARSAAPLGGGLGIDKSDYDTFERVMRDIQLAFGREDLATLRTMATPEMVSFLSEELAENAKKGVVNIITEPRLLQGDLAESWREGDTDYATVAMRFSIVDVTKDRASGRIVAGDPTKPEESTEIWTFRRAPGEDWKLAAIQQP